MPDIAILSFVIKMPKITRNPRIDISEHLNKIKRVVRFFGDFFKCKVFIRRPVV